MALLDTLNRKFGRFTIPNVTIYIIVGQLIFYLLISLKLIDLAFISFIPQKVIEGEFWRIVTFIFTPPLTNPVFLFFELYIFYLMGTALEGYWGSFKYNLFLFVAVIATIGVSFITPLIPSTNIFIVTSIFLAFAFLYPDFELYIFFILPVKIKWLALITWIGYFISILFGSWTTRLLILASVSNFLLFFGKEILLQIKSAKRQMSAQASHLSKASEPFHKCNTCGITDKTNPDMDFRYCTDCEPNLGYCKEHIDNHKHIKQ